MSKVSYKSIIKKYKYRFKWIYEWAPGWKVPRVVCVLWMNWPAARTRLSRLLAVYNAANYLSGDESLLRNCNAAEFIHAISICAH